MCGNIQSPQKIDDRGKNLSKRSSLKDVVKKGRKYAVLKSTGLWLENCPMTNLTQEMWLEIRRSGPEMIEKILKNLLPGRCY